MKSKLLKIWRFQRDSNKMISYLNTKQVTDHNYLNELVDIVQKCETRELQYKKLLFVESNFDQFYETLNLRVVNCNSDPNGEYIQIIFFYFEKLIF